tara:strand:+ start:1338 stop:4955 length:3618 start_codon:yes stop_codon:yes gene_type:complete
MGAEKTPSHIRGLLIPDPRFNFATGFDDTNSVFTENTPRPGVPVAKDNSDLILETSGETSSGAKYTVYTQNSGYPEDLGGTFLYHDTSSTDNYKYYGWEPPHTINGLERVDTGTSDIHYINYDCCTALDDTLIVAGAEYDGGQIGIWHKGPKAVTWTEVLPPNFIEPGMVLVGGERPEDLTSGGAEAGTEPGPALVVLPSGRVLCFYWIQTAEEITDSSASESKKHWQIQAVYSDDSGATWAIYQNFCLIEPLSQLVDTRDGTTGRYYPGRLRAEYKDGQILMICSAFDAGTSTAQGAPSTASNVYLQFASSSLGASFSLVEKNTRETESEGHYDIAVSGGKFVISYIALSAAGGQAAVGFLGSAYTPLSRLDTATVSFPDYGKSFAEFQAASNESAFSRADLSICAAPDGSMYLTAVRHGHDSSVHTKNSVCVMFSADNGNTWELIGGDFGTADRKKDGVVFSSRFADEPSAAGVTARDTLRNVATTWQRGRLVLACRFAATPSSGTAYTDGVRDYHVSCLYLGGYTNLTIGSLDAAISMADRGTYARHWLPFVEPADIPNAWTVGTSGGVSKGLAVEGILPFYKISTSSGEYSLLAAELNHTSTRNTRTESGTWGGPMRAYAEFAVEVISGGSATAHQICGRLTNGNENAKTQVALNFRQSGDNTEVGVRDSLSGTQLHTGTITFSSASAFGEYRMLIVGRKVTVWYREYKASEEERTWIKFYESSSDELSSVTGAGFCKFEWGNMSVSTSHSRWYKVQAGAHDGDLNHCAVPRMNDWVGYTAPDNVGGRFYSPSHLYMKAGLQIAAKDGPAVKGDEWELIPRHDYPIEAIHHEVSPSPAKGWKSNGRSVASELIWNIDAADPAMALGGSRALYLGNINFRHCLLKAYNGTSWDTIATIDAAQKVRWERKGNTVTAYHTGVSTAQKGDRIWAFNDMVNCTFNFKDTAAPELNNISSNSGGVFEDTGDTKAPVLIVDGAIASSGTIGDGQIWAKDMVVYLPDSVVTSYERIKLEIPVDVPGVTGSGTNKTVSGDWEIGTAIWGHVAVFGRQYSNGHIREISPNSELFTATGGQRRAVNRGPSRRAVEFSWVDPVDISAMGDTRPSPDYIQTQSGAHIVASLENTPFLVQGLLSRLQGSVVPVVFLPSLPVGAAAATQIDERHRFLYGRVVTANHRIENQLGEEWIGGGVGETVTVTALRIEEEV